jgi:glucose-1-phosphate thymidylyltransferase
MADSDELRGVVLAGGTGSRLFPLTKVTNKHLLPVGREPMIFHPVKKLVEAGVREILIVTGTDHMGAVVGLLGSGKEFGCEFTYRVQDEAGGIAQALGLARRFGRGGRLVVILGDNIFEKSIADFSAAYRKQPSGAKILVQEVDDPGRYGVAVTEGNRVVRIVEKPKDPPSRLAVTGIYFYDQSVYEIIDGLAPSRRGELEITDVNRTYLEMGELRVEKLGRGFAWLDTGTPESLLQAANYVETIEARQGLKIACLEEVAYRMGFIDRRQLLTLADALNNDYGRYVRGLAEEADPRGETKA